MKPFNRIDALQGKPVETRNGRKVTILGEIPEAIKNEATYPIVGHIEGSSESDSWAVDGKYYHDKSTSSINDLVMKAVIKEGWIAYGMEYDPDTHDGLLGFATHVWPTEEHAIVAFREGTSLEPKGTQKVSWEE